MSEFERLYEQYARDVYRFALYLSGNPGQAEDITSEVFVRVFTSRDEVRTATVKAYLFTIARNLYVDGIRREARSTDLPFALADPRPGVELQTEARESLKAVLQALQTLPEADRSALLMRAQDGMPYEEIAAALGISVAAAKVKVHRARVRISEIYARSPKEVR
jgi:RNA polymerase sigma-70 factor (ECF subfamily)